MRSVKPILLTLCSLLLVLSSAGAEEPKRDLVCRKCNMKVTDDQKRFSVIVPSGIEFSAFDDIGCAIAWRADECAMRQEAFDANAVVHDHETGTEVAIQKAFFVVGSGVRTPMGYGVLAFGSQEKADAFVSGKQQGKVVAFGDMEQFLLEQQKQMQQGSGHHGDMQHQEMQHACGHHGAAGHDCDHHQEMQHQDMQHHDGGQMHHSGHQP